MGRSFVIGGITVLALALIASTAGDLAGETLARLIIAAGLLTALVFVLLRESARRRRAALALHQTTDALNAQIAAHTRGLRDSNASSVG